jgi:DNA-binding IclR family transcriptional regulator
MTGSTKAAKDVKSEPITITIGEIQALLGKSRSAASHLVATLEAAGLRRKGVRRGTYYFRRQFMELWEQMDTRP